MLSRLCRHAMVLFLCNGVVRRIEINPCFLLCFRESSSGALFVWTMKLCLLDVVEFLFRDLVKCLYKIFLLSDHLFQSYKLIIKMIVHNYYDNMVPFYNVYFQIKPHSHYRVARLIIRVR